MSITQPLHFLNLSTGPLDPIEIKAVHLCTYSIADRCPAIALWCKDDTDLAFFPHDTPDAELILTWVETQLVVTRGEQFLPMFPLLFAVDSIATTLIDDDKATIFLDDVALPFVFTDVSAIAALRRYAVTAATMLPGAVTLAG